MVLKNVPKFLLYRKDYIYSQPNASRDKILKFEEKIVKIESFLIETEKWDRIMKTTKNIAIAAKNVVGKTKFIRHSDIHVKPEYSRPIM